MGCVEVPNVLFFGEPVSHNTRQSTGPGLGAGGPGWEAGEGSDEGWPGGKLLKRMNAPTIEENDCRKGLSQSDAQGKDSSQLRRSAGEVRLREPFRDSFDP